MFKFGVAIASFKYVNSRTRSVHTMAVEELVSGNARAGILKHGIILIHGHVCEFFQNMTIM